jgi:hypothetical protein
MSTPPIENLEARAIEERQMLHERASELRGKVKSTRDKLDIRNNVRERFATISVVAAAIGLLSGYASAGLFTRR